MNTKNIKHKTPKIINKVKSKYNKLLLLALVFITAAVYYRSMNNKLLPTWDDNMYITENNDIRSFHGDSLKHTLKTIFSGYVAGNYHPLTMLSFCIEYEKYGLNPKPYHVTNLLLHLLNTLLVFFFIWLLTRQQWVAFITALLFAIHPMHVESVSWVSERKDVLYAFFFLGALCLYLLFLKTEKRKWGFYVLAFVLFILSLLSKGMAVSLPIVLLAIDYFLGRKTTVKTLLEKIPFLLTSAVFGYIAIVAQRSAKAMDDLSTITVNFSQKIFMASYGLMTYLWKLLAPINLSCHYMLPVKHDGKLPVIFYIAPLVIIAIAFLIYKSRRFGKEVIFGFAFFLITIALVLQILPVGETIIAERYTYLSYIGLFFIMARLINKTIDDPQGKYTKLKIPVIATSVFYLAFCFYLATERCKVWENDFTLWTDAIAKEKDNSFPYDARAFAYFRLNDYDAAIADYSQAIRLNNTRSYYHRGLAYYHTKRNNEALNDFTSAIKINPDFAKAYSMRAIIYTEANNVEAALSDYDKTIQFDRSNHIAWHNRGILYKKNNMFPEALENFNTAIQLNPFYAEAYNNRGIVFQSLQKYEEALSDYNKAITIQPDFARPYYFRGMMSYNTGNKDAACKDLQKAAGLGYKTANEAYNSLCR